LRRSSRSGQARTIIAPRRRPREPGTSAQKASQASDKGRAVRLTRVVLRLTELKVYPQAGETHSPSKDIDMDLFRQPFENRFYNSPRRGDEADGGEVMNS
jgi:hypothetical protein